MSSSRLMLLDSASLYFRAFFGVPDRRMSSTDPPNNALRGFLDMIATLVAEHRPTHLIACWDDDWRPAFRVEAIPTYKSHRLVPGSEVEEETPADLVSQVPVIVEALAVLGIARVGMAGYEADDVIGSYAAQWGGSMPIDIVTGDRDLFQLVDDAHAVRVIYTARGGVRSPDLVDEVFLMEKYAVASGAAYADMAALRGDSSDGLPGVAGIGEKTAAKLIGTYGSLAGLRAAVDGNDPAIRGAQRTRLEEAAAYLDVAPLVVNVARGIALPDLDVSLPRSPADPAALGRLVESHDCSAPVNRLLAAMRAAD